MMRYLIYCRVSPKGSGFTANETTVGLQEERCRQFAALREGTVAGVVVDEFESGKTLARPGMARVLEELRRGGANWDALLVYKLDRLTRSMRDFLDLVAVVEEHGKSFASVSEQIDLSTPVGRMIVHVLLALAQWEREMIAERVSGKMTSIAARGLWPGGVVPLGYKRPAAHDNKLVVDEAGAVVVRDVFRSYAGGESAGTIAIRHGWGVTRVVSVLRSKAYRGLVCYDGAEYPAQHPAIIDEPLWLKAHSRLPGTGKGPRPNAQSRAYLLAGMLHCPHGHAMTSGGAWARGKHHFYYRVGKAKDRGCRCKPVEAISLEKAVIAAVQTAPADKPWIAAYIAEVQNMANVQRDTLAPELAQVRNSIRDATAARERLIDVFAGGGVNATNAADINARLTTASQLVKSLEARATAINADLSMDLGVYGDGEKMAKELRSWASIAAAAGDDPELQRNFLRNYVRNVVVDGDQLCITLNHAGNGSTIYPKWLPDMDSNHD